MWPSPKLTSKVKLYNDTHQLNATGDGTFHLFTSLPPELRLLVWSKALEYNRIIHLHLVTPIFTPGSPIPQHMTTTITASDGSQHTYMVVADCAQPSPSMLLGLNHEARYAALEFYRVRIPCCSGAWDSQFDILEWAPIISHSMSLHYCDNPQEFAQAIRLRPGLIYMNPDFDFIRLSIAHTVWDDEDGQRFCNDNTNVIVDFFHGLKTRCDFRGVGVRNLIVDPDDRWFSYPNVEEQPAMPAHISTVAMAAFRETMTNLQNLYFYGVSPAGRSYGAYCMDHEPFINHAYPAMAPLTTFHHLPRDPRAISACLSRVPVTSPGWGGAGPLALRVSKWLQALRRMEISVDDTRTRYRLLVAADLPRIIRHGPSKYTAPADNIRFARGYAEERFNSEKATMADALAQKKASRRKSYLRPLGERERKIMTESPLDPVLGFWLFPLEAMPLAGPGIGTCTGLDEDPEDDEHEVKMDLSATWPELCLLDVQEAPETGSQASE